MIRTFIYFLFNSRKTYRKEMNNFCTMFHDFGLVQKTVERFKCSYSEAQTMVDKAKAKYKYDIESHGADVDFRVNKIVFDKFYWHGRH